MRRMPRPIIRRRVIVLDPDLKKNVREHRRILLHEYFHFVWVRLGNPRRWDWEARLRGEWSAGAQGEAGWSAEWRKKALSDADVTNALAEMARILLRKLLRHGGVYIRARSIRKSRCRNPGAERGRAWFQAPLRRQEVPDIIEAVKSWQSHLRYAAIAGVAALLGVVACSPSRPPRPVAKKTNHRKHAPEFALKDASGKLVHLADYQGKVVLLDFWATWCGPCKIEIPWFTEFQRKYKDRGFEVLGVSMDDDGWKSITPFVTEKKINYRIVLGDDKTGDKYGGLEALPTTFVIDRDGRIASVHVGLANKKDFSDAIEKLLEDPAVPAGNVSARRRWPRR